MPPAYLLHDVTIFLRSLRHDQGRALRQKAIHNSARALAPRLCFIDRGRLFPQAVQSCCKWAKSNGLWPLRVVLRIHVEPSNCPFELQRHDSRGPKSAWENSAEATLLNTPGFPARETKQHPLKQTKPSPQRTPGSPHSKQRDPQPPDRPCESTFDSPESTPLVPLWARPSQLPKLSTPPTPPKPQPGERQVHPIARSLIPSRPTVHANRRSIHPKVLRSSHFGHDLPNFRKYQPHQQTPCPNPAKARFTP
jgi:hypothetical protein